MSQGTSIEWTDATWNPVRGCTRVSEGCRNCYAERVAARFSGGFDREMKLKPAPFHGFAKSTAAGPRWTGRVELIPSKLDEPLHWRKPLRIFVNSMSDLFHESLPDEAIAAVFGVMAACPQHTFQILTKRPERMRRWFEWIRAEKCSKDSLHGEKWPGATEADELTRFAREAGLDADLHNDLVTEAQKPWPLPNVWLGVSVEDQAAADERIPHLLATPAAVRFVSYEPALGPVDFTGWLWGRAKPCSGCPRDIDCECGYQRRKDIQGEAALDQIIVGGESGPGARPSDIAWARSVVEQCKAAGVACFVKQLGARPFDGSKLPHETCGHLACEASSARIELRDRKGGDMAEWPEDLRVREFPQAQLSARHLTKEE